MNLAPTNVDSGMTRLRLAKVCFFTAAFAITAVVLGAWIVGGFIVTPASRNVGQRPDKSSEVSFPSASGNMISGWLTEVPNAEGAILLLHGIRSDRRSMLGRATFFESINFHTLCIDLQAHGESEGEKITMGYLESMDVAAGVQFLRDRFPHTSVVVAGTSLGAASSLMAHYTDMPDAFIAEAVFLDLETALENRLRMKLGASGSLLAPLLSVQVKPRIGVSADELSPFESAALITKPTFVIVGSEDRHATPEESQKIYQALGGEKELWIVAGAGHVDIYRAAPEEYRKRVTKFLQAALAPEN